MALESILFCPDTHIPYHDKRAWALMLKAAKDLHPKHIVVIGDLLDFFSVSTHSKDPKRSLRLQFEVEEGNKALDQLDALGAKNKLYIEGNHCDRLQRYLQDKAPEVFDFLRVKDLLRLVERGWKHTPYKKHTKLGKLHLTHDVGTAGRYAHYKALDTYQHSVVTGHTHRMGYVVEGNATGEVKLSASFGWLGDAAKVDYMSEQKVLKDWALGFGVGWLDTDTGLVYTVPVPIVKYTCVVNGRLFKG